jgi:hypothetical protein
MHSRKMTKPTNVPANIGRIQGGQFAPGHSGNPAGKKPGTGIVLPGLPK